MFMPNRMAQYQKVTGRNLDAEETYGEVIALPLSIVTLARTSQKTAVRTDSSASRGNADQMVADGKILTKIEIEADDKVLLDGAEWRCLGTHPRYTAFGIFDHYEVTLELMA